jgi:hypothetical protein
MASPKPRLGPKKHFFACSFERGLKLPWALSRCPGPFCVDQSKSIGARARALLWKNKPNPAIGPYTSAHLKLWGPALCPDVEQRALTLSVEGPNQPKNS